MNLTRLKYLLSFVAAACCIVSMAEARVIGRMPPPEVLAYTSIHNLDEDSAVELKEALRIFAQRENLVEFPDPPRGVGKQFAMGIYNENSVSLFFEKLNEDQRLMVECDDFSEDDTACETTLERLRIFLGEVSIGVAFWVYRRETLLAF